MNNPIKIQDKTYQLAASVTDGGVEIYGQTLHEVCRFHELSIKRVESPDLKAIERGKYALFMLDHIMRFDSCDYCKVLNRIVLLCDCAIDTLAGAEKSNRPIYSEHISAYRQCRRIADELRSVR